MINKIFGTYKVLEFDKETSAQKAKKYWICECQCCGNIIPVRQDNLKRNPKNCPNCRYNNDYTGQHFGKLTAISKAYSDKNGHVYWNCQCECGNITTVSASNLKEGRTKSCSCLQKEKLSKNNLIDITGQTFGKLTVIERVVELKTPVMWKCQCECGNITIVKGSNLKNGHTISCGCIRSKGEAKIRKILNELQYFYLTEYIFMDLPNRRYDFYLPDYNICIEFDGKQHFYFTGTWYKTQEEFEKAIQRDKEKTDYCVKNNIKLIRIPYYDENKLTKEYLQKLIENTEE